MFLINEYPERLRRGTRTHNDSLDSEWLPNVVAAGEMDVAANRLPNWGWPTTIAVGWFTGRADRDARQLP
jgi:hypothetical protein